MSDWHIEMEKSEISKSWDWYVEIKKSAIPESELFRNSYFDVCRTTDVGSKIDKLSLTPDQICILMLPFIGKDDIDKYMIDSDMMVKYLLKLIYKIKPTINPDFAKINNINNPVYFAWLKQLIETTDHYDFLPIYIYIETFIAYPETGNAKTIKKLLKIRDKTGNNFLLWILHDIAPEYNCEGMDMIHYLLDNFGADSDTKTCYIGQANNSGYTALMLACIHNIQDVAIKMLNNFGSKCNIGKANKRGDTALILACYRKLTDVALKIIEENDVKCDVGKANNSGCTALLWACTNNMSEVAIKMLTKFGAKCNVGKASNNGTTALFWACTNKLTDVAMTMLTNFGTECNIEQKNELNDTALMWACDNNLTEVVEKINELELLNV